jgi:hypothetical protein
MKGPYSPLSKESGRHPLNIFSKSEKANTYIEREAVGREIPEARGGVGKPNTGQEALGKHPTKHREQHRHAARTS